MLLRLAAKRREAPDDPTDERAGGDEADQGDDIVGMADLERARRLGEEPVERQEADDGARDAGGVAEGADCEHCDEQQERGDREVAARGVGRDGDRNHGEHRHDDPHDRVLQPTHLRTPSHVASDLVRIVLGSDERTPLTDAVVADLEARGADVTLIGPPAGEDLPWSAVGRRVGDAVAHGEADTGVLFCWTGTGVSIAANKVRGVRAALCTDAETAAGARRWNDANVLVMSLRLTSAQVAGEMLDAWFATEPDPSEKDNVAELE